jgi:hypothetical protein
MENTRGMNLATVKLTTVQVTKLPLLHKISKVDMVYIAKPGLTVAGLVYSAKEEFTVFAVPTLDKGETYP